jgi:hypothetical protein
MPVVDPDEQRLTVTLESTGEVITDNIQEYRIETSYLTPTDSWSFTVYNDEDPSSLRTKFRPWQPIRISIAGQTQLVGRIEKIKGVGESGAALEVSGYDYLYDSVAGSVDPALQIKKEMDLGQALLAIFEPFGIKTVYADFGLTRNILSGRVSAAKGKPAREFKKAHPDELRPKENQGTFEFAETICHRMGYSLQSANLRDGIICCVPHDLVDPMGRLARPGNILKGSATRDWSSVPTVTIARGRGGDPNVVVAGTRHEFSTFDSQTVNPIAKIPEIQGIITADDNIIVTREKRFDPKKRDSTIYGYGQPVYRPLFYQDKDSKNQEQLEYGVSKMVAERLKKTLEYECTVRGHVDPNTGAIWSIDSIVDIFDFIEQVDERMWLYENTKYNDGQGPMTSMRFVRPDSYIL